jgi:hypothetical protein
MYGWNRPEAEREAKTATTLRAGVEAIIAQARLAAVFGQWDRASQLMKSGVAIDPLDPIMHMNLA